jgi:hypothetical protein
MKSCPGAWTRHLLSTKTFFRIPPNRAIEIGNQIQIQLGA